jgi:hypothetical protein
VGRFFLPDEDAKPGGNDVVVLSYGLWANKFGSSPGVIGKVLTLNATSYTVIGVAPRGFKGAFTFGNAEQVWVPVSMYPQVLSGFFKDSFNTRRFLSTTVIGRLKPAAPIGEAEASLKTIASRLESEFPKDNASRSVALENSSVLGISDLLCGVFRRLPVGIVCAAFHVVDLLAIQLERNSKLHQCLDVTLPCDDPVPGCSNRLEVAGADCGKGDAARALHVDHAPSGEMALEGARRLPLDVRPRRIGNRGKLAMKIIHAGFLL